MSENILGDAPRIATEACSEGQPMPNGKTDPELIADCCEIIAEAHAKQQEWRKTSTALRMACWYYRKALA